MKIAYLLRYTDNRQETKKGEQGMNRTPASEYSPTAKTLHWVVALLVVLQFIFIFWAEELPREDDLRGILFRLHFSTGISILVLAAWRVTYRFMNPPPMPGRTHPPIMQKSAWVAHWAMYVLIFALPITGWMLVATAGGAIDWYWLFEIPNFVGENEGLHETLEEVHEILGFVLLFIAASHILTTVWYQFIVKDGTMDPMLKRKD